MGGGEENLKFLIFEIVLLSERAGKILMSL